MIVVIIIIIIIRSESYLSQLKSNTHYHSPGSHYYCHFRFGFFRFFVLCRFFIFFRFTFVLVFIIIFYFCPIFVSVFVNENHTVVAAYHDLCGVFHATLRSVTQHPGGVLRAAAASQSYKPITRVSATCAESCRKLTHCSAPRRTQYERPFMLRRSLAGELSLSCERRVADG